MKQSKKIIIYNLSIFILATILNYNYISKSNETFENNLNKDNQNETIITKDQEKIEEAIPNNQNQNNNKETSQNNTNKQSSSTINKNETIPSKEPEKNNLSDDTDSSVIEEISWKEKNQIIITKIKNTYGYNVSYGSENFWYGGVASTLLTDEELANKALNQLYNASSVFPNGFFKTFQGYNGFRVILFDHINGAAGVASYEFGDDNYLALDVNNGYLGRVFFHETFHIMEQYINYKTYNTTNPFNNWSNSNPKGFIYGDTGKKYTSYDINELYSYDNPSEIAFVSEYAKTRANEDRAELFADLMFRGIKKQYMSSGFAINEKAKELSLILRNFFPNSVGARWEKYITW